jgi:predicted acylesterase/phospholipase RssA
MDIRKKTKLALVLSGGGIKAAAFHIGVCLALEEKGFRFAGGTKDQVEKNYPPEDEKVFRMYVGSSAGSFISSILAAGYSTESLIQAFEMGSGFPFKHKWKDDPLSLEPFSYRHIFNFNGLNLIQSLPRVVQDWSVLTGGLETLIKSRFKINGFFNTAGIERYLRKYVLFENDFRQLGVDLFVIGTQLNHSRKAIFGPFEESRKTRDIKFINYASISDAVAASTALPPVFAPYPIKKPDGKEIYFFDGEIRDTLSTHVAADNGADLVISSYSVQPYHFSPDIGSLHKFGIPVIINQALYQVIQQKIARHIQNQNNIRKIHEDIDKYLKEIKLSKEQRMKVLEIIEKQTNFKPNVDYIYIHPHEKNHEMFFVDHFSLNPEILARIVKIGFKSCLNTLRQHNL